MAYAGEDLEQRLLNAADTIKATERSGASATERLDAAPKATYQIRREIRVE